MRLATIRLAGTTTAVRLDSDRAVETGDPDVGALLARPDWQEHAAAASGPDHPLDDLDYAPLVPAPEKIVCVGQNYRRHIEEMGRQPPDYPTLFAKFRSSLIGAYDDIVVPGGSNQLDWEAELAVVIGAQGRHLAVEEANSVIAGYAVMNDVTARDWQYRTTQWLQGKTFEHTTPLGPALVTLDEAPRGGMELSCWVDGELMQRSETSDLVFDAATIVAYVSEVITLRPGDVIATGTPGGVGHARKPPRYLVDGTVVRAAIEGIGECRNLCRDEKTA